MTDSICIEALQQFASRIFTNWQGLPDGCPIPVAETILKVSEDYGVSRLGQQHKPAYFRTTQLEGYVNFARVWYRNEKIVLIDGDYPAIPVELAALLKSYGEPAAKYDYYQDVIEIKAGEWVYPQRGITLFMNADSRMLAKVAVYPSTSLADYLANLSPQERLREFNEDEF